MSTAPTGIPVALVGARVFTGDRWLDDHAVVIAGGRIQELVPVALLPEEIRREPLAGGTLAPGFVDLQVNGGGGVLFNDQPTVAGIGALGRAHRPFGTTGLLPTFITDFADPMRQAIAAARQAVTEVPGILGIHVEGPFISPARKGIHNAEAIRKPTVDDLALLTSPGPGHQLVTLAPEEVPAGTVRKLADAGVVVSAGHSAATYDAIQAARGEGVRAFTHLFNAMSQLGSREPGVVGAALEADDCYCGIIADGHHVHPASLRLAYRRKGPDRLCLVTDAMSTVGSDAREFSLYGRTIYRAEGRLTAADGTLAGADIDMAACVRNAIDLMAAPLADALRMASTTPAACLGDRERGRIAPGCHADLVHLDDDLQVRECWLGGRSMAEDGLART